MVAAQLDAPMQLASSAVSKSITPIDRAVCRQQASRRPDVASPIGRLSTVPKPVRHLPLGCPWTTRGTRASGWRRLSSERGRDFTWIERDTSCARGTNPALDRVLWPSDRCCDAADHPDRLSQERHIDAVSCIDRSSFRAAGYVVQLIAPHQVPDVTTCRR
jgi:hypothetical protein